MLRPELAGTLPMVAVSVLPTLMTTCLGGWGSNSPPRVCSVHLLGKLSRVPTCLCLSPILPFFIKERARHREDVPQSPTGGDTELGLRSSPWL